eukprot:403360560
MGCSNSKENPQQPKTISKSKEQQVTAVTVNTNLNELGFAQVTAKPVCAQKEPYKVDLVQGQTYYWCSCGKSKKQPFCDGSHKGSEFIPRAFVYDKPSGEAYLCGCKHNKRESGPFCDGSHKNLDW